MSFTIFQNIKSPFQAIKRRSSKSRKIDIVSKGSPILLVQKWPFFQRFLFQAIKARKMSFTIFQNGRSPFQAITTTSSKSLKTDIFSKRFIHGNGQKMAIFSIFFFKTIYARKMSFTIFQNGKSPFQAIKQKLQKVEKFTFFQKV